MKNVFVVSWIKSENYGTCLQAYATNKVLSKYCAVKFLGRRMYYPINKLSYLIKKIWRMVLSKKRRHKTVNYGRYAEQHNRKLEKVNSFVQNNYIIKDLKKRKDIIELDTWVDVYIVGSDQMWNPWMLSPSYLLDFVPPNSNKRKCSYAASFGVDNIPNDKKNIYRRFLKEFDRITVREPKAAELVQSLSGVSADVVCDPTFLISQIEWREFAGQSKIIEGHGIKTNYMLCYFIGSSEYNHLKTVQDIAKALKFKVVLLPMKVDDYAIEDKSVTIIADACPYDFVSLIDNAALVCTDSFHAVVFSFLMNTPFYNFPRFKKGDKYSQDARLQNIMTKFGLEGSYWNDKLDSSDIKEHLKCDYTYGYSVLEVERKRSLDILWDMIGEDNGTSD